MTLLERNLRWPWLGLAFVSLQVGCVGPIPSAHSSEALSNAEAEALALQRLFPEIDGPIDRRAIEVAVSERALANLATTDPRQAAYAALNAGDFEQARQIVSELVSERALRRARELLAAEDARAALAVLDRAVQATPASAEAHLLRAETALSVASVDRDPDLFRLSRAEFLESARLMSSAEAWLGASRAARLDGDPTAAVEYAERGLSDLDAEEAAARTPAALYVLVDAAEDLYALARDSADGARSRAAGEVLQGVLERLVQRRPEDPRGWRGLVRLDEERRYMERARASAERALARFPNDPALHESHARIVRELAGNEGVLAAYVKFTQAEPRSALGAWYEAGARLEIALEDLRAERDARPTLAAAAAGFVLCRTLAAEYGGACRVQEALCSTAVGWAALRAQDLDDALRAFLSVEDAERGGLVRSIPGTFESALVGLERVGAAFEERTRNPSDPESAEYLVRATRVFDYLHRYAPENVAWANNAGFFNRDAAIALRTRAHQHASRGDLVEANRDLARALEMMEASYSAYAEAARLVPDDPRIQNDTGLILVYYLQRDVEAAESYLRRAARLGETRVQQLRADAQEQNTPSEEQRMRERQLEEAVSVLGDAYQNLGVLALTLQGDPKSALPLLESCLDYGPDPREEVRGKDGYLEQCRSALSASGAHAEPVNGKRGRWDAPLRSK